MAISVGAFEHLLRRFSELDLDNDNQVSVDELYKGLSGVPSSSIEKMVAMADTNKDGLIDIKEFINMMRSQPGFSGGVGGVLVRATPEEELSTMKLFSMMDENGNGYVTEKELQLHLFQQNITLGSERIKYLYKLITGSNSKNNQGFTFQDLLRFVTSESSKSPGSQGSLDFGGTNDITSVLRVANAYNIKLSQDDLTELLMGNPDDDNLKDLMKTMLERKDVQEVQPEAEKEKHWSPFINFKRRVDRQTVMSGLNVIKDVLPGEYSLPNLVEFDDLPPILPRHAVIENCIWIHGDGSKKGTLNFPESFNGEIPTEIATSETVGYYGAFVAESMKKSMEKNIFIGSRHAIEDFTYAPNYYEKWVLGDAGGAALEFHEFHHLDMPLTQDSGHWILAKWANDDETELHVTAFKVPVRHTIYTPGGVMHTNNHLKGKWRTMLSDGQITEALLKRGKAPFGFKIMSD